MRLRGALVGLLLVACGGQRVATAEPTASPPLTAEPTPYATASPSPNPTPSPAFSGLELAARVELARIEEHLTALQGAADTAGGTRATGTPGFEASAEYVTDTLAAAGYSVETQAFTTTGLPSVNLIAELPGDASGVIMLGAHLDSVPAGPGINDNGSGVAALLTLAIAARELAAPDRTIRFAFWGAEEGGPFGSATYVERLSVEARDEIDAYLNLDMLGSPNPLHFVYDEDDAPPGSEALTALVADHVEDADLPWAPIDLDRRSDHGPFAAAGIPVGGLFSGGRELVTDEQAATFGAVAGQPSDPCSDARCDTIANVDVETLTVHARVVAAVIADLAAAR